MSTRMGVREFRENFTAIARDATEPVIVTNHDKVVGWFTPAKREPVSAQDMISSLDAIRKRVDARGAGVAERMKALGLEDDALFEDAWRGGRPLKKGKASSGAKRRK